MASHRLLHKRPIRISPVIVGIVVAAVFSAVIFIFFFRSTGPYRRQTMVLVGSPMTVLSWNETDRSMTLVNFPEYMAADGTHGYGTYSFEAFWKLGEIDKKDGTVLAESISEALGIPVNWYVGPRSGIYTKSEDALTLAKRVFSASGIGSWLTGRFRTNIPLTEFIKFVWLLQLSKPDRMETFDFSHTPSLIAQDMVLADGSHQLVLATDRVDSRLAHLFEDDQIRRETLTTSVYNTTQMPSLGTRAARLLGNLGVSVVTVGNDTPEKEVCTIDGTESALKSKSAKVIEYVLGCKAVTIPQSDRTDLTVRIGKSYAKRFLPNN